MLKVIYTFHISIFGILPFDICFPPNLQTLLTRQYCRRKRVPFVSSARYLPPIKLSVFKKIVLNRDSPIGLYFRLNLSKRWKLSIWACISNVSIDKSYGVRDNDSKTCRNVKYRPSRTITTSCMIRNVGGVGRGTSGQRLSFDLMKRRRCFWFMLDEWWTWVSTLRTL